MNDSPHKPRPFQFGLGSLLLMVAAVAIVVWLLPFWPQMFGLFIAASYVLVYGVAAFGIIRIGYRLLRKKP